MTLFADIPNINKPESEYLPLSNKHSGQLLEIFNQVFLARYNTCLQGGGDEPIYRPADEVCQYHRVIFTRDYFASALHEIAHWCVAGEARRQLQDYGYWYAPDGRCESQQGEFERVEVVPQALEWMFSRAAGIKFRVSADNLAMGLGASDRFKDRIHGQVLKYCQEGVNPRAAAFIDALRLFYRSNDCYLADSYSRASLDA